MKITAVTPISVARNFYTNRRLDLLSVGIIAVVYFVFYSDVLFAPYLIGGIDFQIPLSNLSYYFRMGEWSERNLGYVESDFFSYNRLFTGFIGIISLGEQVMAQKIFFFGLLFAGISCYVLIRNHITENKMAAIIAALFYMLTHYTIQNYGTGLIWEMAFAPLAINFGLNFLSGNRVIRNLPLFIVTFTLAISFGVHALLGIPIMLFVFFITRTLSIRQPDVRWTYLGRMFLLTIAGIVLFMIVNPGLVNVFLTYSGINANVDTQASHVIPKITVDEIFQNYQSADIVNSMTLANWTKLTYFYYGGLAIVLLSLIGLVIFRKRNTHIVIAFAANFGLLVVYSLMIHYESWLFPALYAAFPFLALFRGTEGTAPFILVSTAILLAFTLSNIIRSLKGRKFPKFLDKKQSLIVLAFMLLLILSYSPAFSPQQHIQAQHYSVERAPGPVPYPTAYLEAVEWLNEHDDGTSRAIMLPTSFLAYIYVPLEYSSLLSPISGYEDSNALVRDLQQSLIGGTAEWGKETSVASLKYIVVPYKSDEPEIMKQNVLGQPSIWEGLGMSMTGDPHEYKRILDRQSDLRLIHNSSSFAVYENTVALPKFVSFEEPAALVGANIPHSEWARIAAESGTIPLTYDSKNKVPAEFTDHLYIGASTSRSSILTRAPTSEYPIQILQDEDQLAVFILNTNAGRLDYLFNVFVNGDNRLTQSGEVLPQQTGVAFFSPEQLQLADGNLVYLVDSIGNQISNALIWQDSDSGSDGSVRVFIKENGENIPSSEFEEVESVLKISPSEYILNVNSSKPFYVYFSESYSDNWKMHIGQTEMKHYRPPFGNLFFVDSTGDLTLTVTYENSEVHYIRFGIAVFIAILVFALINEILPRKMKDRIMNMSMQRYRSIRHVTSRWMLIKEKIDAGE
jgi:hypothetical protein